MAYARRRTSAKCPRECPSESRNLTRYGRFLCPPKCPRIVSRNVPQSVRKTCQNLSSNYVPLALGEQQKGPRIASARYGTLSQNGYGAQVAVFFACETRRGVLVSSGTITASEQNSAPAGNRTRGTSMGSLYVTTTLLALYAVWGIPAW